MPELSKPGTARSHQPQVPGQTLNIEVIKYVQSVFKKADLDGGGDLDEHEFAQAFAGKLNTDEGSDEECMRKLFYRMDANGDGAIGAHLASSWLSTLDLVFMSRALCRLG